MFYFCHTGCSLTNKKCVCMSGQGRVPKSTNMGALKTTSRQKRIGMRLGICNCFPFSRAGQRYLAVPTDKLPPGEGFGGTEGPQNGTRAQKGAVSPQAWQSPPLRPSTNSAGTLLEKILLRGFILGNFTSLSKFFNVEVLWVSGTY